MKKRILSFLLACFMVASTFIISRPIIDVHAVEADETEWIMDPGAFYTGNGTDGPFQIGDFANSGGTFRNVSAWAPAWNQIAWGDANIVAGASAEKWSKQNAWASYKHFYYDKSEGSDLRVNPFSFSDANQDISKPTKATELAVAFTAPEDGIYSYKEVVHSLGYNADGSGTKQVIFKVKKGTAEINATAPELTEDFEGTLKGLVALKKGDVLYFTANAYGTMTLAQADNKLCGAGIDELVIAKLDEEDFVTYEFSSDLTGAVCGTNNAFTLRGYNHVTGEFLDNLNYANGEATVTGITTSTSKFFWLTGEKVRMLPMNAGYDYSSVIEFTAPIAGDYLFDAKFYKEWDYNANTGKIFSNDFLLLNSKMEVLNESTTYNPSATTTRHGLTFDFALKTSVHLEAGESIYLMTRVNANANSYDADYCGARIEYLEVNCKSDHPCSAETLTKVPYTAPDCVNGKPGNLEHWKCSCGVLYANADATSVLFNTDVVIPLDENAHAPATEWTADEVGHWYACNHGCDEKLSYAVHDWSKNDGVCAICDYECTHTNRTTATCNTPETCTNCKMTFGDVDKNNHASEGVYVNTGKGTHRFNRICCDDTDIAEEACTYGDDNVCDKCGYDNTALENAETNNGNALDNYLNKDNADYEDKIVTVVGPQAGDLDDYGVTGNVLPGAEYKLFNIDFDANGNMFLRHHFIIENNAKVYLNGTELTLNNVANTNIYYFDVTPVAGKYHVADAIKVVSGDKEETYNVSLYSYIKIALGEGNVGQLSDKQLTLLKSLYDLNEEAREDKQILVGMANQSKNQIEVYDISVGNMNTPIWTYKTTATTISGFKLRDYAPYGKVVLTAAGKIAEMVSYDTKELIWRTTDSSGNTHSIELLPNGIIVTGGTNPTNHASAPGCTLTFFNLHGEDPSECILEVNFNDAHGVLWDPAYNRLWATGGDVLNAYEVVLNDDGTITLTKDENLSIILPEIHAHDLQPYGKDVNKLLVSTWYNIYLFDKQTGECTSLVKLDSNVKGIGILPTGELVYMYPDGLAETWNTTWINIDDLTTDEDDENPLEIHSDQGRFYKLRVWDAAYQ